VGKPIAGNVTDAAVAFAGRADPLQLRGRRFRLRFELRQAEVYAFACRD